MGQMQRRNRFSLEVMGKARMKITIRHIMGSFPMDIVGFEDMTAQVSTNMSTKDFAECLAENGFAVWLDREDDLIKAVPIPLA